MIVMINEVEEPPLGAGDVVASSIARCEEWGGKHRSSSPRAVKWVLTPLYQTGYPIDEETASVAEDVSGETSSEGTSRI